MAFAKNPRLGICPAGRERKFGGRSVLPLSEGAASA